MGEKVKFKWPDVLENHE